MYLQQHAARTTTPSRTVTARVEQHDLDTRLQQHAVRTTTPARTRRPPAPPPASSSTTPLHALPAARRKNDDASSNSESRSSRSPTLCRNGSSSAPARRAAQIPGASECGGREDLPLAQEGASQRLRPRGRQCRRATRRPTAHARSHPPATRVTTPTAETPSTPYSRTCCTNTRPATAPSRRTAGRGRPPRIATTTATPRRMTTPGTNRRRGVQTRASSTSVERTTRRDTLHTQALPGESFEQYTTPGRHRATPRSTKRRISETRRHRQRSSSNAANHKNRYLNDVEPRAVRTPFRTPVSTPFSTPRIRPLFPSRDTPNKRLDKAHQATPEEHSDPPPEAHPRDQTALRQHRPRHLRCRPATPR